MTAAAATYRTSASRFPCLLPQSLPQGVRTSKHKETGNCTHFEWEMNGVGLEYNHLFGFGVLDAAEMVMLAMVWKTSPPRYHCEAGTIDKA